MPGTVIRERSQRVPRTLPTDTGVLIIAGPAERGRSDQAHVANSLAEFELVGGKRVSYSLVWDMVEDFFQEGGSRVIFSRVFGPAPTTASVNLLDAGAAVSLVVSAASPGDWGASLNVAVEAGDDAGQFKIRITHDTDTSINELSPSFVDQAAAVEYYRNHSLIRVALGASALDPAVVAATSLVGGTDDRANATDATWEAALTRIPKDLGPGQVVYAGRTTGTAHQQLLNHAAANNRFALADVADTAVKATLLTAAATFRGLLNSKHGMLTGPWVDIPGLTVGAATRAVPASASFAGRMAAAAARGLTPNEPAAGDNGVLAYATGLRATFSDADADELNAAALNLIRDKAGLKVYGYRTGADKTTNPLHWQAGNARLYMDIAAKADAILESFVLREIDGRNLVFKELASRLMGMLHPYWEAGSLYGATPNEAYYVDTDSVNTVTTKQNGEIHAALELTMSPMGETVVLDIVRRAITA